MKYLKKVLISLLLFSQPVSSFVSLNAADAYPYWTDVGTVTNNLSIEDGTASMRVYVRAYNHIDRIEATVSLQREYINGQWRNAVNSYFPSSNDCYLIWSDTASDLQSGYHYRLHTKINVYELSDDGQSVCFKRDDYKNHRV